MNMLPNIEGRFWLYGCVWGDDKPKLYIIEAMKVSNGFLHSLKGDFLFDADIAGFFFITELRDPKLPE